MKTCPKCHTIKSLLDFSKGDGWCKSCKSEHDKAYRLSNLEKQRARCRAWRAVNKEKIKTYNRERLEQNRNEINAKKREYDKLNHDKRSKRYKEYVQNHRASNYLPYEKHFPEINVSRSKPVDLIAREIERRIMPELLPLLEIVKERERKHQAHVTLCRNNAQRLADLLGCVNKELYSHNDGYQYDVSNYLAVKSAGEYDHHRYVKAEIHGDRIDMKLDGLTVGDAEAIIRIAKGLQPFPAIAGGE